MDIAASMTLVMTTFMVANKGKVKPKLLFNSTTSKFVARNVILRQNNKISYINCLTRSACRNATLLQSI